MSAHAIERLLERVPGIDPQVALDYIRDALTHKQAPNIAQSVTGEAIHEVRLPNNKVVFPVIAQDGTIKTVVTEGMTLPTTLGVKEMMATPEPTPIRPDTPFEIRTLAPDEKITEPGFYQIDMDRHHNQPCDGVSVTSGILRKIELATPADVWATHKLNPNRLPPKETDALRLGRVMAAYIEHGPDGVAKHVLRIPGATESYSVNEMIRMAENGEAPAKGRPQKPNFAQVAKYVAGDPTPAGRKAVEFWKAVEDDPRTMVTAEEWETICAMGEVLAADPMSSAALGGIPEITMAWFDEITDLWCLARPDQVSFSGMTSDYKKISAQGQPFNAFLVDRKITQFGYDMQMAFAAEGLERLTRHWPDTVGIVAQCGEPPHHPILRGFEEDDLRIAMFRNQRARRTFRECLDSGNWWGPGEDVASYRRPEWQRERLIEEMNTAGVAAE